MTLIFPDCSHWNGKANITSYQAAFAKATEATTYVDPTYTWYRDQMVPAGKPFSPYHYANLALPSAQADWCFRVIGARSVMMDWEWNYGTTGKHLSVADMMDQVRAFTRAGCPPWAGYLPRGYWREIGSPDLRPLFSLGLVLISSDYDRNGLPSPLAFTPYGGVQPTINQFTSNYHSSSMDANRFPGTPEELGALIGMALDHETQKQLDAAAARAQAGMVYAAQITTSWSDVDPNAKQENLTHTEVEALKVRVAALEKMIGTGSLPDHHHSGGTTGGVAA